MIHMTHAVPEDRIGYTRIILYIDRSKVQEFDRMFPHLDLELFLKEHYGVYELNDRQQDAFLSMCKEIKHELDHRGRNFRVMVETEIIRYFIGFIREMKAETPIQAQVSTRSSGKYQTIYAIADYISEHYSEPITLDHLASVFFLSKFYLSRSFKEVTGYGVNEYVNILRTRKAKQLLEETSMSISEIAMEAGYESITYFEKVFKTYMTVSPLKYRKTLNGITFQNPITPEAPEP